MTQEELLDAIGDVDEEYIAEAEKKRSFPFWLKPLALCAFLAMALMVLSVPFQGLDLGAHGEQPEPTYGPDYEKPSEQLNYLRYTGPLLPLTLGEACPEITAVRRVEYDFSPYDRDGHWTTQDGYANVVDSYTLTNGSDQPQTVTLVYPYISRLILKDQFPCYTLNGEPVTPTSYPGPASGTYRPEYVDTEELQSYLEYAALLSDGSYYARAMDEPAVLDIPVTVYRLSDFTNQSDPYVEFPCLRIEFEYDPEQTALFTDHLSSGLVVDPDDMVGSNNLYIRPGSVVYSTNQYEETGIYFYQRRIHREPDLMEQPSYLIVMGKDLDSYRLQGYKGGFGNNGGTEPIDGVGCTLEKYESTLGEILRLIIAADPDGADTGTSIAESEVFGESFGIPPEDLDVIMALTAELLYDMGIRDISQASRFQVISAVAYSVYEQERVFYDTLEVTVPAGETVEFVVNRPQYKSHDNNGTPDAYDLCTTLGSNLRYTEQTVRISNWDRIKISHLYVNQNYDFDLENGITEMTLDLNKPHYWMEVTRLREPRDPGTDTTE
ncbi:MAG: hypothetical protein IJ960_05680 [Oscillospiraceae bacterium]|nr:hypothetical protein [Oscillospiraceae bacterium]